MALAVAFAVLLALLGAKRLVHQLALAGDEVAEFLQHLPHLAALAALGVLLRPCCSRSSMSRSSDSICWAASLEPDFAISSSWSSIFCRSRWDSCCCGWPLGLPLRVALGLLGELAEEIVERLSQLRHQLLDFFLGGAVLDRLGQPVLRLPQPLLGFRQVTLLQPQRQRPQLVDG